MLGGRMLAAIALLLAVLDGGAVDAAVWRVPVQRHVMGAHDAASYLLSHPAASWRLQEKESTMQKAKHSKVWMPSFPDDPANAVEDADFTRVVPGFYAAEIMFGTPPQPISLVLSLGGSDIFVLNHKLPAHAFYDHTKSSSYRANGTRISIGEHTAWAVQGFVSTDCITIPGPDKNGDGLAVLDLSFVEMTSPDSFLKTFNPRMDGFVGLGARAQNATGTPSIIRSMITQRLLDQPVVGVQLSEENIHLTIGGLDPRYAGSDVTYFSDTREEAFGWWVPLTSVHVDGKQVVGSSGRALINEAVEVIAGPADQVSALASIVGATGYTIPCEGPGPDITITFGTFEVTLTKADYAIPKGDACLFAFFPAPASVPFWQLGRPVLKHVYMALDYGTAEGDTWLGLAHLKPA